MVPWIRTGSMALLLLGITRAARLPRAELTAIASKTTNILSATPTITARAPSMTKREEDPLIGPVFQPDLLDQTYGNPYAPATNSFVGTSGTVSVWTAANSEHVTQVLTTTVNGQPSTKTIEAGLSIAEVTAAADGLAVGDWKVVITPAFWARIEDAVSASCTLRKRDNNLPACGRYFSAYPDTAINDVYQRIRDEIIRAYGLDIGATLTAAGANAGIAIVILALAKQLAQHYVKNFQPGSTTKPWRLFDWLITKGGVEKAKSAEASASATKSSSACPSSTDPPVCSQDSCDGSDNRVCRGGSYKGCKCGIIIQPELERYGWPDGWLDTVQHTLQDWDDGKYNPPWCLHGGSPNGGRVPEEYCQCGPNHGTMYPVATSTSDPCPYNSTSHPDSTIIFSTKPPPTLPTKKPDSTAGTPTSSVSPAQFTPADGLYNIAVLQWMEKDKSSVTWAVSASGHPLGEGSGSPVNGAPTQLWMDVTSPLNLNTTYIEWGYLINGNRQKLLFSTGTEKKGYSDMVLGGNGLYGCTNAKNVDKWLPIGAGWQRSFTCRFPGKP